MTAKDKGTEEKEELTSEYKDSWAVVVGINEYRKVPKLRFAVSDARSVAEVLENSGFDRGHIIELTDRQATRQNIQDLLSVELARKTGRNDRVLFFFAGHGRDFKTPTGRRLGYLMPSDGDPDYLASRCISMDEVGLWSEYIPAKHILYVMDCCYSGLAAVRGSGVDQSHHNYIQQVMRRPVRQIITAGRADQRVFEEFGHGIFTRMFIQGLKGEADLKGRGFVTGFDLGHYLESRVHEESRGRQQPLFRYLRGDGEFVFTEKPVQTASVPREESFRMRKIRAEAGELQRWIRNGREAEEWVARHAPGGLELWEWGESLNMKEAQWLLGYAWASGGCRTRDEAQAAVMFYKSARNDYAPAQYSLALCYQDGVGVLRDLRRAGWWLEKAVRGGLPEAELALGLKYMDEERNKEGAGYFLRAARKDCVQAQYNLGVCLASGLGVERDMKKAFAWFNRAAQKGYDPARVNLAVCLARGLGAEPDAQTAARWYSLSRPRSTAQSQNDSPLDKDMEVYV